MTGIFLLPIAVILSLSIIYWNDLGLRVVAVYLALFALTFLPATLGASPYVGTALQGLLAAIMLIHAKANDV